MQARRGVRVRRSVWFGGFCAPFFCHWGHFVDALEDHLLGQVCGQLHLLQRELGPLLELEVFCGAGTTTYPGDLFCYFVMSIF